VQQRIMRVRRSLLDGLPPVRQPRTIRRPVDSPAEKGVSPGVGGFDGDGPLQQNLRFRVLRAIELVEHDQGAHHEAPRIDAVGLLGRGPITFFRVQVRLDGRDHAFRDVVLNGKDVLELAIIARGPDMLACLRVDQLRGDADASGRRLDAALQDVAHAELTGDLPDVDGLALEGKARVPGDHEQPAQTRERRGDLLGDAVRQVIVAQIAAHIVERQHRDRGLVESAEIRRLQGRHGVLGLRIRPRLGALIAPGRRRGRPQRKLGVAFDDRQRLVGEQADEQLVDGRLAELRLEGELLARHPFAREMILDRSRDPLAVVHPRPFLADEALRRRHAAFRAPSRPSAAIARPRRAFLIPLTSASGSRMELASGRDPRLVPPRKTLRKLL
jgi:hypothetical protein